VGVGIATDHGFGLNEELVDPVRKARNEFVDGGACSLNPLDDDPWLHLPSRAHRFFWKGATPQPFLGGSSARQFAPTKSRG
jgi:hypothetical protein